MSMTGMTMKKSHRLVHRHACHAHGHACHVHRHARHAHRHARHAHHHARHAHCLPCHELYGMIFRAKPEPKIFLVKTNQFSVLYLGMLIIAFSTFIQLCS